MQVHNLIGQKFGRLTVVGRAENSKGGKARWICVCDCGKVKEKPVLGYALLSGRISSCGCKYFESNKGRNIKHGMGNTRLNRIWDGMKRRCKVNPNYSNIKVCDEWQEFENFFMWAIANGYSDDLTIDRIDNSKGYSPANCRWATYVQQANNRKTNHLLTINGETHTLKEWSYITCIPYHTLQYRAKCKWPEKDMLLKPDYKNQPSRRKSNGT